MKLLPFLLAGIITPSAFAYTISAGRLIEDFTTLDAWDSSTSTGLWNIVTHAAQAGRVANSQSTRPISFGDGSDGTVVTSGGYTFDTDTHPNGYNFVRLSITGGTITVRGRNPLVIRSLTTVTITPTLDLSGTNGSAGAANGSTSAPSGGTAVTCYADGGAGGSATPGNGGVGKRGDNQTDVTGGAAVSGAANCSDPTSPNTVPPALSGLRTTFDTGSNFVCGAGGAGGGGHRNGGSYSTGGGGGGGGGTIHVTAVGDLSVGSILANGGSGGANANDGNTSGNGSGANGGAIWLQTLGTLSTSATPSVSGGAAGGAGLSSGLPGNIRGDASTRPAWAAVDYDTSGVATGQSYEVQGVYDLGTVNAAFFTAPTFTQTLNGGTITPSYAGSTDGSTYTAFTTDLTSLSNRSIRYLKVKLSISTTGATGIPQVSQISIPLTELDVRMMGGCGTLVDRQATGKGQGPLELTLWATLILLIQSSYRKTRRRVGISSSVGAHDLRAVIACGVQARHRHTVTGREF